MASAPKPPRADQFVLRMPDGMRDRIMNAAAENGRSMNSEIVATLLEAYPEPTTFSSAMLAALQSHLREVLQEPVSRQRAEMVRSLEMVIAAARQQVEAEADSLARPSPGAIVRR